MTPAPTSRVKFYPVLHLMTGPPGLARNGGIWKKLKSGLRTVSRPPRFMVQVLHFTSYGLSDRAWHGWLDPWYGVPRIQAELNSVFGSHRDLFADSGGFQLLHRSHIDLSRWGLDFNPEGILELQRKFAPTRLASLDAPLSPVVGGRDLRRLTTFSLDNAVWLAARDLGSGPRDPVPYLVAHGRSPGEIRRFLDRLEGRLGRRALRTGRYSIALGSQVPLSRSPHTVVANAVTVLRWMDKNCPDSAALHVFGVGDAIVGEVARVDGLRRELSYDNSTYVQNAFRLRIFDGTTDFYRPFSPGVPVDCDCAACRELAALGHDFVREVMSAPAYTPFYQGGTQVNRSDILALMALHNLSGWKRRVAVQRPRARGPSVMTGAPYYQPRREDYAFPLKSFQPIGENLLLLPCSKFRPYGKSPSHRKVMGQLESKGFKVATDFDRITLSGFFGPVHWKDENLAPIMSYDFRLSLIVDEAHLGELRYRTASVLNVIRGNYASTVAYLRSSAYEIAFGDVLRSFDVPIAHDVEEVTRVLSGGTLLANA
jgi:7-cyano-7-deazaguanine tRNA-ribosyltransferase